MADDGISNDVVLEFGPATPHSATAGYLLYSESFSDVKVHLDDDGLDVIGCHQALLGVYSYWFRDQLMNRDGRSPKHIWIPEEISRGEARLILEFIYTSRFNPRDFLGKLSLLESIIRAWRLAHYFGVESLQSLVLESLHVSIRHWYKTYGDHVRTKTLASFPTAMVTHLTDAIAILYGDNKIDAHPAFRSPLLATALCGIHVLRTHPDMASLLDSSPAFAADWARLLMHRWTDIGQVPSGLDSSDTDVIACFRGDAPGPVRQSPATCARCLNRFDRIDSELCPNLLKWAKRQVYEELCWSCMPELTLEEWMRS